MKPLVRNLCRSLLFIGTILALPVHSAVNPSPSNQQLQSKSVLFKNVRVFDGKSSKLSQPVNVLVEGNMIRSIGPNINIPSTDVYVIDGQNKTLMPGLIDAHWHTMMAAIPMNTLLMAEVADLNFLAAQEANNTLMRGFTSVRDLAGSSFSLKRAIDRKIINGPRI